MLSTLDLAHVRARDPSQACQLFLTDSLFQACGTHRFSEGQRWLGFKCGITQFLLYTPLRIVKCQFGFVKARYKGLAKNDSQLAMLFTLANLVRVDQLIRAQARST